MSGCSGPVQLNSDYLQTLKWHNLSGQRISVFDPSHCGMWTSSCIANMSFPTWKLLVPFTVHFWKRFGYLFLVGKLKNAISTALSCFLLGLYKLLPQLLLTHHGFHPPNLLVLQCSSPVWQCLSCTGESKLEATIQIQHHRFWPEGSNHFLQPVGCELPNAAQYAVKQNTTHCTSSLIREGSRIWSLLKVLK